MTMTTEIQIHLKDGPFAGRVLSKHKGSFDTGTLLHFHNVSYRIEWDSSTFRWIAYCVDNGSL